MSGTIWTGTSLYYFKKTPTHSTIAREQSFPQNRKV